MKPSHLKKRFVGQVSRRCHGARGGYLQRLPAEATRRADARLVRTVAPPDHNTTLEAL